MNLNSILFSYNDSFDLIESEHEFYIYFIFVAFDLSVSFEVIYICVW